MVKMGILGMGKMGEFHAGWMTPENQLELVAVCERKPERIEQLHKKFDVRYYTDCDEFLQDEQVEFAVIVTTHESHEELTVKALNAGKHVVVEKPMSMTYASTQRMIAAAEKNERHLFVHQSSRWDRDFLLLKQMIASGKLGEILSIESNVTLCDAGWPEWGIDGSANPWRIKAEYGGGMLFDWGPHLVDEIMLLMNKDPLSVYGMLQRGVWSKEVDDYFLCILRFDNDVICKIQCSNNARLAAPRWYVIGNRGTYRVEGRSEPVWDTANVFYEDNEGQKVHEEIKLMDVKESGIEGGFYRDLVPFLEGKIDSFVSMHEASKVVKILELTKRSSEENQVITF
jgi:scyllo-inositol 2-dehydrogenase (NADP+)